MKKFNCFLVIFLALAFFSCTIQPIHKDDTDVKQKPTIVKKSKGYGPPPHAPAHGYRHKHQHGVEVRYDSSLGAYVVVEIPDMYLNDGLYIRWSTKGYWEVGYHYKGPWRVAARNEVPDKLDKNKGKGKGKGHYKYKGK